MAHIQIFRFFASRQSILSAYSINVNNTFEHTLTKEKQFQIQTSARRVGFDGQKMYIKITVLHFECLRVAPKKCFGFGLISHNFFLSFFEWRPTNGQTIYRSHSQADFFFQFKQKCKRIFNAVPEKTVNLLACLKILFFPFSFLIFITLFFLVSNHRIRHEIV